MFTFSEIKRDYQKLIKEYGYPYDMTGGFVDAEKMEKVILNPTRKNAAEYMRNVIVYGFQHGEYWRSEEAKIPIHKDDFLLSMYEKYMRHLIYL